MDVLAAAAAALPPPAEPPAPAYRRLTQQQRWSIVALHNDSRSSRYIAKHLHVDRKSVSKWLKHHKLFGDVSSGSRSGRPRCTDEAEDTLIASCAYEQPFTSPRQIRRRLDFGASISTIDRRLQEAGLFGRVARHKRNYKPAEMRKRLSFANGYGNWKRRQWHQVIFADEKCFYGKGFCGRVWVRRPQGEALNPEYCVHKTAHPVKVNVWACFSAAGQGYMHIFNENLDGKLFARILKDNLEASCKELLPEGEQRYFLMDNAKTHNNDKAKEAIHLASCIGMDFPPYSPDLNPIENLWSILAREVEKVQCETVEELQDVIAAAWEDLDKDVLRKLARSMRKRCKAVIRAEGYHTKY